MKISKNSFIKATLSLIVVFTMIVSMMSVNVFASELIKKEVLVSNDDKTLNRNKKSIASKAALLPIVYVDSQSGFDGSDGSSVSNAVNSINEAVNLVQEGGIIYCLNSVRLNNNLTLDGKGATLTYDKDNFFEDSLIKIQNNANVTFTNLIIDGQSIEGYIYDMVYIDSGTLTLGEGTIIQKAANNYYGAALGIYSGSTVNLNGTQIINNRSGVTGGGGAHAGGVTVGGTLNVNEGTVITGNKLFNTLTETDILINSSGKINLSGDATIGTIAFGTEPSSSQIFISSSLKSSIKMRMHSFFSGSILLPDFTKGNILASGKNGHTLSDTDKEKLVLASPNLYLVKLNDKKEAYVDSKSFKVTVDENIIGGSVKTDKSSAIMNEKVILTPQANLGYKYKSNSLRVYQEGNYNSIFYINNVNNILSFNMGKSNVIVEAKFEKLPATDPIIVVNIPTEKKLSTDDQLELTVQVDENDAEEVTYQWYKGTEIIDGETSSTLTIESVNLSDSGDYYVKVTHTTAAGEKASINSNTCKVSIIKQPSDIMFTTNIATEKKLAEKDTLELNVAVTAGNEVLTYQWYKDGVELIGQNSSTLKVSSVDIDDTGEYYVKVFNTNEYGAVKVVESNKCNVTVVKLPSEIVILSNLDNNKTLVEGEKLELIVNIKEVSEGTLTYQWYKDGVELKGAKSKVYNVKNVDKSNQGKYYVKVTNTNSLGIKKEVLSNECLVKVAIKKIEVNFNDNLSGKVQDKEVLWKAALSDQEKKNYLDNGVDAFVYLKMTSLNSSVDEQLIYNKLANKKMGTLLDISVFKKIGSLPETSIKKLKQEIYITVDIPKELQSPLNENRKYYIVRVHHNEDGTTQTDILNDLDNDINTITFKTNLFSTYALVYEIDNGTTNDGNGVKTEDNSSLTKPLIVCLLSMIILTYCLVIDNNSKKKKV